MIVEKKWNVAGGLIFFKEITNFLRESKNFYGMDENFIDTVYDCHSGLNWGGGRFTRRFDFSLKESARRVQQYNDIGIGFNVAFNNTLLTEEDLDDQYCNWFLEQCHREGNGVIVASELLRKYIKDKYPRYKIIASICHDRKDLEFYKEALNNYDIVVLHPDLGRDLELVKQLDTSRIEVLANEYCVTNCKWRTEHYKKISESVKSNIVFLFDDPEANECIPEKLGVGRRGTLVLEPNEINKLYGLGITHFKLQGREGLWNPLLMAIRKYIEQDTIQSIIRRIQNV